jgi:hypothetical protein
LIFLNFFFHSSSGGGFLSLYDTYFKQINSSTTNAVKKIWIPFKIDILTGMAKYFDPELTSLYNGSINRGANENER